MDIKKGLGVHPEDKSGVVKLKAFQRSNQSNDNTVRLTGKSNKKHYENLHLPWDYRCHSDGNHREIVRVIF